MRSFPTEATGCRAFSLLIFAVSVLADGALLAADDIGHPDFGRDIRPILANHCWSCHGPDPAARKAGLRLDQQTAAFAKTENGVTPIVPANPAASELVTRILAHDADVVMPPPATNRPLSEVQKQTLIQWIRQGAPYTKHWAFEPPRLAELPTVQPSEWPITELDHFILEKLHEHGLQPAEEAEPNIWLRRVTLDLTGLPPSPDELDIVLAELESAPRDEVYARVADRLLSSSAYAERMAMLWLDAARYADTNGYNNDEMRTMWPWRDWVIRAFADDMPYDQFLTEQLAGDLLPNATVSQKVATGFNRNHVLTTEGGIIEEEYHVEYVADRVHTTATVFMALSLQCARCHDHKFDPIPQREYYQFAAFFNNVPDKVVSYSQGRMAEPLLLLPTPEQQMELDALDLQLTALQTTIESAETAELKADLEKLTKQREELNKSIPRTMVMAEPPEPRKIFILKRGAYDQPGEQVQAAIPVSFYSSSADSIDSGRGDTTAAESATSKLTRLDLARWLTRPDHPLTSRVAVNRLWEMLFGIGLVETSEDFGVQGALPSHPELLDWLAVQFVRNGWSQRDLLKRIVLSATYRQSSRVSPELLEKDPDNRLLSRGPRFRLPAEVVRDNALFVSGLLAMKVGGPSVKPYQPAGLWEDVSVERREKYVPDTGDGLYRRSMYTFWKRTCPPPSMSTFDAPDRESCVIRRSRTNTPLQALVLLNDPTYIEAARKLGERVCLAAESDEERIRLAFRIMLSRLPDGQEAATLQQSLRSARVHFQSEPGAAAELLAIGVAPQTDRVPAVEQAAWTAAMSVLLNLDESISKP